VNSWLHLVRGGAFQLYKFYGSLLPQSQTGCPVIGISRGSSLFRIAMIHDRVPGIYAFSV